MECPPLDRQKLILDLRLAAKGNKIKILVSVLNKDKIRILGTETDSINSKQMRIELSETEFRKLFSGSVEYKLVEKSSESGLYCQRYVLGYTIPARYKKYIRMIQIPDPQFE
ncbi:hypothetical protein [Leptospira ainazelensis]|uniref:hypothetical protein n=1 Tax=Leptospira ainazelensis TaxID=2810034 RepID=UPI001E602C14|nr:hypothetical protein [Leptospira ainazelensis]